MDLVREHHVLERRLWELRFLEAIGHAAYRAEDEEALADAMEALWYRLSDAERRRLEEERARDREFRDPGPPRDPSGLMVVVDDDGRSRRGSAPRGAAGA